MGTRVAHTKAPSRPTPSVTPVPRDGLLQRKCACSGSTGVADQCDACRYERLTLKRRPTAEAAPAEVPPIVHEVLRSPGQALDSATRVLRESRFGHDFSQVRVHTDSQAAASAYSEHALAYTVGQHIVFGRAQYQPHTSVGQRLLAHELTHVVQQRTTNQEAVGRQPVVQYQTRGITWPELPTEREASEWERKLDEFRKEAISKKQDEYLEWAKRHREAASVEFRAPTPAYLLTEHPYKRIGMNALADAVQSWAFNNTDDPEFLFLTPSELADRLLKEDPGLQNIVALGKAARPSVEYFPEMDRTRSTLGELATETVVGLLPIIGEVADVSDAVTGVSITGHTLSTGDRVLAGIAALIPFVPGSALRSAKNLPELISSLAVATRRSTDEIEAIFRIADHLDASDVKELDRIMTLVGEGRRLTASDLDILDGVARRLKEPLEEVASAARKTQLPETGKQAERRLLLEDLPRRGAQTAERFSLSERVRKGDPENNFYRVFEILLKNSREITATKKRNPLPRLNKEVLGQTAHSLISRDPVLAREWERLALVMAAHESPALRQTAAYRALPAAYRELPLDNVKQIVQELPNFEKGKIGRKILDNADFFLDQERIVITDITLDMNNPWHRFKTLFYRQAMKALTGLENVRAVDTNGKVVTFIGEVEL